MNPICNLRTQEYPWTENRKSNLLKDESTPMAEEIETIGNKYNLIN